MRDTKSHDTSTTQDTEWPDMDASCSGGESTPIWGIAMADSFIFHTDDCSNETGS